MCLAKVTDVPSHVSLTDRAILNCMKKGLLTKDECLSMYCNFYVLNQDELKIVINSFSSQVDVIMYRFCKSVSLII
jgi:Zn-finger protein